MRPRLLLQAIALTASASLITACGGGGGGSNGENGSSSVTPPANDMITLTGRAVKGTLAGASVKIYSLNEYGGHAELLWSGETDETGTFTATLKNPDTVVDIVVSAVPGKTRMRCDVIGGCGTEAEFGKFYTLNETFQLERTADPASEKSNLAVTPWTHMAAQRARELVQQGSTLKEAAQKALSETSDILGVDISRSPADIADSSLSGTQQAQYAVANAALAKLLKEKGALETGLKQLAESFADGKFDSSDAVTIGAIKNKLNEVVTAPELTQNPVLAENTEALNLIAASLPDDELDPEASDTSNQGLAKIETFKSFVKQVRSWVTKVEETSFRSPLDALQIDAETVAKTLNETSSKSLDQFTFVFTETANYIADHPEEVQAAIDSGTPLAIPLKKVRLDVSSGQMVEDAVGQVSVTILNNNGKIKLVANSQDHLMFDGGTTWIEVPSYVMDTSIPFSAIENGTISAFTLSGAGNYVKLDAEMNNQAGYLLRIQNGEATFELNQAIASNALTREKAEDALQLASVKGTVTILGDGNNLFSGDILAEGVKLNVPSVYANTLKHVDFKGTFFGSEGRFDAEVSVTLNNAESFDPFGTAEYYGDHWRWTHMHLTAAEAAPVTSAIEAILPKASDEVTRSFIFDSYVYADTGQPGQNVQVYRSTASGTKISGQSFTVPAHSVKTAIANQLNTFFADAGSSYPAISADMIEDGSITVTYNGQLAFNLNGWGDGLADGTVDLGNGLSAEISTSYLPVHTITVSPALTNQIINEVMKSHKADKLAAYGLAADFFTVSQLNYIGLDSNTGNYSVSVTMDYQTAPGLYDLCLAAPLIANEVFDRGFSEEYISNEREWVCRGIAYVQLPAEQIDPVPVQNALEQLFKDQATISINGETQVPEVKVHGAWQSEVGDLYIYGTQNHHYKETEIHFADLNFTLKANAALPELPEATVTLSGHRSQLNGGKLSGNVNWDGGNYSFTIESPDVTTEKVAAKATFFNADGMKLIMETEDASELRPDLTGEAYVGEERVGRLMKSNGNYYIRYNDGTFESLL